jgi:hypothetical protein
MGNTKSSYTLRYNNDYKVVAHFDRLVYSKEPKAIGVECMVYSANALCDMNESDIWYKDVGEDGSFTIYTIGPLDDRKWYLNIYSGSWPDLLGCFVEDDIPPQHYVKDRGAIRVKDSPSNKCLSAMPIETHWRTKGKHVLYDEYCNEFYYIRLTYHTYNLPLEFKETVITRRLPLLKFYITNTCV